MVCVRHSEAQNSGKVGASHRSVDKVDEAECVRLRGDAVLDPKEGAHSFVVR